MSIFCWGSEIVLLKWMLITFIQPKLFTSLSSKYGFPMINTVSYKIPLIHQLQMQYVSFHFQNWKLFLRSEGFKHLCVEKLTIMNKDRDWKKKQAPKLKSDVMWKYFILFTLFAWILKKYCVILLQKSLLIINCIWYMLVYAFKKKNKFKGERTSSICVHHCLNATTLCLKQNYFWSQDH